MDGFVLGDHPLLLLRRRWAWVTAAILLGLAGLDTAIWWTATGKIEAAIPSITDTAARSGWRMGSGTPTRGGWPFAATVSFPAVQATRPLGGLDIRWHAATVNITLSPWEPRMLLLTVTGAQSVSIGAATIPVQAALADVRVPLAGGSAIFEVRDMALGEPGHDSLRVEHLTGEIEALVTGFTADGVLISPALQPPFDTPLTVSAGLHLSAGFSDAGTPEASARAWQEAGGRVEVPAMALRWGPLTIAGSGDGGLDGQLQPQGQARLQVTGAAQLLDAAGHAGLLSPGPEAAARAVLGLLALASRGGPVPLTVSLADRTLTVAQFPLLRVPLLSWH